MKLFYLAVLTVLLTILSTYTLDITDLVTISLSDKLSYQQINNILDFQKKWEWVSYLLIVVFLLIKIFLITSVLYIGTYFYSKKRHTFKELSSIVIKCEYIFLIVVVFKIVWFCFFQQNYTLEDIKYFYPLSSINITGYENVEPWFIYPLQAINLFELVYWLLLSYYIGKLVFTEKDNGKPMDIGIKIVASSYGSVLFLWIVVVMFFTLNYS